jgi:hypothetical protein
MAETLTLTIPDSAIALKPPTPGTTTKQLDPDISYTSDLKAMELLPPDMTTFNNILEDLQKFSIQAGTDFKFKMQWRTGDMPTPFPAGLWPTAELRSAKSPSGIVLATYTITVVDEALVKWSLDLSAAQTAALSGKTGFTEMKIPYDVGVYHIYVRIPTEIKPRVTQ